MSSRTAAASTDIALEATGLVKRYGPDTAVNGLDFFVGRGEVVSLLGPNGAGKTTTVEMCEGFVRPDEGCIRILGLDPLADEAQVRSRIGVMLQGGGAYPGAKAGEMLKLIAAYSAHPHNTEWLLETLGLTESRRTSYRRLSGGQQQRLALACAIVNRPELVFLDEPTAGMDAQARHLVWEMIDALRRDGVGVLLTTHLMDEAESLSDRILIIDNGREVASGTPKELTTGNAENELRFTAPAQLDTALLLTVLPEGYECHESAPGTYLVRGEITPQVLAAVTSWCVRLGALVTDMRVESRSLEDVFLDLTGRKLRS